eukprot:CAMPEP_0177291418 /NCGR_PEP_ID=MMETSP0367-20130122/76252_1 /TAXON_ID=447022 ORGANISM="Scrippsiella hangoei-like, Strain SHHI-4" /NCGR_SAMPLE_ID=MMETSP0367 /ASSEMBLY_ACC=CAM_ASM_000362 /LENGTH=129 /DNA_ID=CAMNT_0018748943 /DNA_START=310 /DNA_END=699 /DNA_ORIENTATION=-
MSQHSIEIADFNAVAIGIVKKELHIRRPRNGILGISHAMSLQSPLCSTDVWDGEGDMMTSSDETFRQAAGVSQVRILNRVPALSRRLVGIELDDVQRDAGLDFQPSAAKAEVGPPSRRQPSRERCGSRM